MTVTTPPALTHTASATVTATTTTQRLLLPTTGTPTVVRLTNLGPDSIIVLQGSVSVVVTAATGLCLSPYDGSVYLAVTGTYIAYMSLGASGFGSNLQIALGT